ncbi:MAG: hypothetical protein E7536_01645 [Ruminococcaceae bacterium]|nr:hypothetical protein [Oscillospiraceae bacterium]
MDEKIGGLSIDDIVGAATDDLNGKAPQQNNTQPFAQPNQFGAYQAPVEPQNAYAQSPVNPAPVAVPTFCGECGSPMTGDFCGNCGWSEKSANNNFANNNSFANDGGSVCENCGAPMNAGEMFCGNCGWQVGTTVQKEFCPECGSVVINGFCQYCQQNTSDNDNSGWLQRFKNFRDGI